MDGRSTDILVSEESDFLQKQNPKSLYNKVSATIRDCVDQIPKNIWDSVTPNEYVPASGLDIRLKQRMHFLATSNKREKITVEEICSGLCPPVNLYSILKDSQRLAYLMLPLKDYKEALEAGQELWLSRIMEILSMPLYDAVTKKPNVAVGQLILKAAALIDLRKHGAPTQRIEQKNVNLNLDSTQTTIEEIDKQLAELENRGELLPADERPKLDIEADFEKLND